MADKLNEFAQKMGKGGGGPPGKIPLLFKLGAAGIAAAYGLNQAMYTGIFSGIFELLAILFTTDQ